jgi:hypothetical protein
MNSTVIVAAEGKAKGEYNDCTVRALSIAAGMPYDEAHSLLAQAGRRPGHRFDFRGYMAGRTEFNGRTVTRVVMPAYRYPTLAQFIKDFPKGTFILRKTGHVFAVKDGVAYDSAAVGARVRIKNVWYFEGHNG